MKNGKAAVGSGTDFRPLRSSEGNSLEMVYELMEAVWREEMVLT